MKKIKIAIVGSGTSGLTVAAFLTKNGYDVRLFEKFTSPQPIGAGLLLQPTGLACLAQIGLDQKIIEYGATINHLHGESVSGTKIFDISYDILAKHIFGLGIHRGSLFTVLYNEVKRLKIPIITNCEIVESRLEQNQRILIDSKGNKHGDFDLVIDASGMRSLLRNKYGKIKLNKPYPYGAIWGVCQDSNQEFGKDVLQQKYDQAKVMIGILPIGRAPNSTKKYVTFFWSMPTKSYQEWRNNGLDPWKERVLNYWPEIEPFITQFTSLDDLAFAEYSDIIMENWHIEKMAFIGDAAHCTSPQLGQGANLGIIDAMQLSQCLKVSDNVDTALNYYNKERFSHIRFYQTTSRWLTPFFQSDSIIAAWMRDRMFNIMCNTPYIRTEMIRTLSGMKNGLFSHINPGIWHERYNLNKTL